MYRLSKCLIVRTRHRPTTNAPSAGATGIGEEFPSCGINFHASYTAFPVQENVVQHTLRRSAAGAKRSESAERSREPAQLTAYSIG